METTVVEKRKITIEKLAGVDRTTVRLTGDVVSVELHCGGEYMARVMFEDIVERMATGRVMVEFGKADKP